MSKIEHVAMECRTKEHWALHRLEYAGGELLISCTYCNESERICISTKEKSSYIQGQRHMYTARRLERPELASLRLPGDFLILKEQD